MLRYCLLPVLACASAHAAEFDCVLEPRQTVELRTPVTGLIERINTDRGQFVRQGQILVELDSGAERAALDVAKHRATMEGAMRSGESRLDYATMKLVRRDDLVRDNFISKQDRDESATEKKLAKKDVLQEFGTVGAIEGVAGPEASNNATTSYAVWRVQRQGQA